MAHDTFYEKAAELHRERFVCNAHADLAPEIFLRALAGETRIIKNRWLADFKKGGMNLVVSSIFVRAESIPEKALTDALLQIAALASDIDSARDEVILIKTKADFECCVKKEKIGVLMYFEGLEPLGNSKELLRAFYEAGARGASLTWSRRNLFADGSCRASECFDVRGGLSALGRETVAFLEDNKMFVDVSHLNDDGFAELASLARVPFIATHSNARAVHFSYRNLTDEQIKTLAQKGGVIGINGIAKIAGAGAHDDNRYVKLCDHIDRIVELAGYDHVGYGFDMCDSFYQAEKRASAAPLLDCVQSHENAIELTAEFLRRGHSEYNAQKLIGANFRDYFMNTLFSGGVL